VQNHRDAYDAISPWATWQSPASLHNCPRELYWDDAYSLGHKFDIVLNKGLKGAGAWSLDYAGGDAELWSNIASHFSNAPAAPTAVIACAGNGVASVSWTPPTFTGRAPIGSYTVYWGGNSQTVVSTQTEFSVAVPNGTPVSFSVRANNDYGAGPASDTSATVTPSAGLGQDTSWMTWYDRASAGMYADNVHLLSTTGAAVSGCVRVPGKAVAPFSLSAASPEGYVALPVGIVGGPLQVTASATTMVSQRVAYFQTFNEAPAQRASDAQTSSYFSWYDSKSAGMYVDNVHVVNPATSGTAHVTISLPGVASPPAANVGPGQEGILNFPPGTIGGPVTVSSDLPVLASQRVTYWNSSTRWPPCPRR